ncbi:MAG: hypothetical protein O9301_12305 [Leptospira sp.]|nr:hypothetical protein [Leptospira sp.]
MIQSIYKPDQLVFLILFVFLLFVWKKNKYEKWFVLFVCSAFSLYIFGPNFKAKFWLIDDHEIFYFLSSKLDQRSWSDFFYILFNQTEVGEFGVNSRFRPSYYVLRLIETFLWKDNSTLWYISRFSILVSFLFSLTLLYRFFLSTPVALAWVFTSFSFIYWADIFFRLGPGETYIVLGFSIFTLSSFNWNKKLNSGLLVFVLQIVSVMIMIGSKENMILAAFLPILFYVFPETESRRLSLLKILYTLPFLLSLTIVYAILSAISANPVDINGNSIQFTSKVYKILNLLSSPLAFQPLILSLVALVLVFKGRRFLWFFRYRRNLFFLLVFLFANILLNIVFYGGDLPQSNRYDFPTSIFSILFFIIGFGFILAQLFWMNRIKPRIPIGLISLVIASFGFSSLSINELQNSSRKNVKRTIALSQAIEEMRQESTQSTAVIYVRDYTDFEPADSFLRYSKYNNFPWKIFLVIDPIRYNSNFHDGLMDYLRNLSKTGDSKRGITSEIEMKSIRSLSCIVYHFGDLNSNQMKDYPFCTNQTYRKISY